MTGPLAGDPLRVGVFASLVVHAFLISGVVWLVHGVSVRPPPRPVVVTLDLAAAPAAQVPALLPTPAQVQPPAARPLPRLHHLPRPLPMPITSHAATRRPPPPVARRVPAPKPAPAAPVAPPRVTSPSTTPTRRPETPTGPQPGVVSRQVSSTYKAQLEQSIGRALHYPRSAAGRGQQGTAVVRVRMLRNGTVESVTLVSSAGVPALDQEAQAVFQRIGRLPALPADFVPQAAVFEFEVPISFHLVGSDD